MTLHLLKMAVGVDSVDNLAARQTQRLGQARAGDGPAELRHLTRNMPRRAGKVLDGGSIYWIIRGYVRVRQRILRLDRAVNAKGRPRCALILDPELVMTELRPHRPMQGWRYFEPDEAPADLDRTLGSDGGLPPEMAAELRQLGLL